MVPRSTAEHYLRQQRLTVAVLAAVRRSWRTMGADFDASWGRIEAQVVTVVAAGQLTAARSSTLYLPDVLDELGIDAPALGEVEPRSLVGVSSDGRGLDTLLYGSVARAKQRVAAGGSPDQGLGAGLAFLEAAVMTQLADAERVATGVGIVARPNVAGYTRMLNPPSCSRCAVLAGRPYRWNAGFQRHPRCFPAGVVVSGPATQAATRRWYQGDLVIIRTAGGQELPATGNHPVLTDRGWVPANLLQEGDHVIRSTAREGAVPLVVPHEQQVPTRIENLWRPDGMVTLRKVPTAPEDFHGDGGHGDVDVVFADGLLCDWFETANSKLPKEEQFTGRVTRAAGFAGLGSTDESVEGLRDSSHGFMCGGGLRSTFASGHLLGTDSPSGGPVTQIDDALQALADSLPGYAKAAGECILALSCLVRRRDVINWQREIASRWDAPAGPFTVESRGAYAVRGEDLRLRLASQVTTDRIVELRRVDWSGHVYNLTSVEGWYNANGLIVSNCDCRHIPRAEAVEDLTTDPKAYFQSLPAAEQDRIFTKAGAQAVRDGADISQVVNARRGMTTAGTTTEGTTRRGFAGRRLSGQQRLMPERIYQEATSREQAVGLLRRHGFII